MEKIQYYIPVNFSHTAEKDSLLLVENIPHYFSCCKEKIIPISNFSQLNHSRALVLDSYVKITRLSLY